MVQQFNTSRVTSFPAASAHQERVNAEMFKAIELLGKKLERSEAERDRLTRRLALIESSATVDEKTGKLYLPVVVDPASPQPALAQMPPKWMMAATLMSRAIAIIALGLVMFRDASPQLTPQQLAALDAIATPRVAHFENREWKRLDTAPDTAPDTAFDDQAVQPVQSPAAVAAAVPETAVAPIAPVSAAPVAPVADVVAAAPAPQPQPTPQNKVAAAKPVEDKAAVEAALPKPAEKPKAEARKMDKPAVKKQDTAAVTGLSPDPDLPARLIGLEKRAFDGVPEAQHDLATLYAAGRVIGQNYKRAVFWFEKAADGGVANAHYNLGVMYQQGLGVKRDMDKSIGWYKQAAELGHPEAMYNLGIAYIEGVGTTRNVDRGVSYFKRAANAGVAQAAYNLGVLYESGFVGAIDLAKSLEWYQVAASENHADASAAVDRIKKQIASAPSRASDVAAAEAVEPAAGDEEEASGEGDASMPGDDVPVSQAGDSIDDVQATIVRKIQSSLIAKGMLPGRPTGTMDQQTEDAIRAFQRKAGMTVDGAATPEVLEKLLQQ